MSEHTSAVTESATLDPKQVRLKELFTASYGNAQQSIDGQTAILKWLVAKNYFDDLPITEEPPKYLSSIKLPPGHPIVLRSEKDTDIPERWKTLREAMDTKNSLSPDELVDDMLPFLLSRDIRFQEREGRPGRDKIKPFETDSPDDPYASLLRRHALSGVSTDIDAFDALYKDLGTVLKSDLAYIDDPQRLTSLNNRQVDVINLRTKWEGNHKGEQFWKPKVNIAGPTV